MTSVPVACALICLALSACTTTTADDVSSHGAAWLDSRGPLPQDAERRLETIYIASELQRAPDILPAELIDGRERPRLYEQLTRFAAGKELKIELVDSEMPWIRDLVIFLKNGKAVVYDRKAMRFPDLALARLDMKARAFATKRTAGPGLTLNASYARLTTIVPKLLTSLGYTDENIVDCEFPLDGGDVITARRTDGSSVVFVGEESLFIAVAVLHQRGWYKRNKSALDAKKAELKQNAAHFTKITNINTWMRDAAGYLASKEAKVNTNSLGSLLNFFEMDAKIFEGKLSEAKARESLALIFESYIAKSLVPFDFASYTQQEQTEAAWEYLAKEALAHKLIAQRLGDIPQDDVVFIPNAFYHLDVFMMPLDLGRLLIQDPAEISMMDYFGVYEPQSTANMLQQGVDLIKEARITPILMQNVLRPSQWRDHFAINRLNGTMGIVRDGCQDKKVFIANGSQDLVGDLAFHAKLKDLGVTTFFVQHYDHILYGGGEHCGTLERASGE